MKKGEVKVLSSKQPFESILLSRTHRGVEALCYGKYWTLRISVFCFLLASIFSFPPLEFLSQVFGIPTSSRVLKQRPELAVPLTFGNWKAFRKKAEAPFKQGDYEPASHHAKNSFRLFVPLVAKLLHIGPRGIIFLQWALGFSMFVVLAIYIAGIFDDKALAALSALNLALLYVGFCSMGELIGIFDSVAFFFLLSAICTRNFILLACFAQCALWTDERALLSCGIIGFLSFISNERRERWKKPAALFFSISLYAALRLTLAFYTDLLTPFGAKGGGISLLLRASEFYWLGIWTYFKGSWLIIIAAGLIALDGLPRGRAIAAIGAFIALQIVPFLVFDVTRSGSYYFPFLIYAIVYLGHKLDRLQLKNLMLLSALISLLSGPLYLVAAPLSADSWLPRGLHVSHKPIFIRVLDYIYYYCA